MSGSTSGCAHSARKSSVSPTDPIQPAAGALPSGARDVLPVEAAELREVEDDLRATFARYGYREVRTPVVEFAHQLERADSGGLDRAYRLFDEAGRVLVLRPDMTIPVARLIATRLPEHPGPIRVSYTGPSFRVPQPGKPVASEHRQAGAELVGAHGPEADAEAVLLLWDALRSAGLGHARIGLGDVSVTDAVLDGLGVPADARTRLARAAESRDLVEWRTEASALEIGGPERDLLAGLPAMRGHAEVLDEIAETVPAAAPACERMVRLLELLDQEGLHDAVLVDLGILRDWQYYSGLVIEAYADGAALPVAQGGRYDGLAARFGTPRSAVGFTIELEFVHRALAGARTRRPLDFGLVLVGGLDALQAQAADLRAGGIPVIALATGDPRAEALAAAEGWRFVGQPEGSALRIVDRADGAVLVSTTALEDLSSLR
jgi:ATP phosphoribosyltransferase regulatory subunit